MRDLGKTLIVFGLVLVAVGIVLSFAPKIPWLGRLPGDIYILRGNFTFYFPLTTCILLSLIITLVLYLFRR
jgi:uncharacterized protein HemY